MGLVYVKACDEQPNDDFPTRAKPMISDNENIRQACHTWSAVCSFIPYFRNISEPVLSIKTPNRSLLACEQFIHFQTGMAIKESECRGVLFPVLSL